MYTQITTKCNFSCEHCHFSCTQDGEHMTVDTFKQVMKINERIHSKHELLTLGGGEPTLHPNLFEIISIALSQSHFKIPAIETNGSQTEITLILANMAKKGVIACSLSLDPYHQEIDPEVIKAFTNETRNNINLFHAHLATDYEDKREIRDITKLDPLRRKSQMLTQRNSTTLKNSMEIKDEIFQCYEISVVKPNGNIHLCTCHNSPIIGNTSIEPTGIITEIYTSHQLLNIFENKKCWNKMSHDEQYTLFEILEKYPNLYAQNLEHISNSLNSLSNKQIYENIKQENSNIRKLKYEIDKNVNPIIEFLEL